MDTIAIEKKILSGNDIIASEIRSELQARSIPCLNLVSSPGSGKTSLLEKTLTEFGSRFSIALIAGDVQTENDAKRLEKAGGTIVRPIVTHGTCHLEAEMVQKALHDIDLKAVQLLIIENVGNLVCPSSYDLGEDMKVVVISTTEGDDKPLKYPGMFRRSRVMVINKIDLLGQSDFSLEAVKKNALLINPELTIFEVSCRTGQGLSLWYDFIQKLVVTKKAS